MHVDRLDAVLGVMADIRQLDDLRREVDTFNTQIRGESERQVLLQAVKDRVISRIDLVNAFMTHVLQPDVRSCPEELKRYTEAVVDILRQVEQRFGSAQTWLTLAPEQRRALSMRIRDYADELRGGNLAVLSPGEGRRQ